MAPSVQQLLHIKVDDNPNFLNQFANYSYQWRLFMVNELTLKKNSFNVLSAPQITLAETGSTSIFIDSVTIDHVVSGNSETLSATAMTFTIEILEPQGSELFDLIHTASIELGVQNWAKLPLYLQLSFRGYDENGEPQYVEGNPQWVWRIIVTSMENSIDEGGARYTLQGFLANDVGITENFGTIQKSISLTSNSFLGMISNLEKQWNEYEYRNAQWSATALVQYKFIFYQDISPSPIKINWEKMSMIESFDSEHPSRARTADSSQTGKGTGTSQQRADFAGGWRVQSVIDALISASSFAEELRQQYPNVANESDPNSKVLSNLGVAKTCHIEPQVIYTAYDPLSNDYEKLIVYHIWPYDGITPVLDSTPASGSNLDANEEKIKQKNQRAIQNNIFYEKAGIVRKVYDYYYTGRNTDILKFDLRFNNFWYAFVTQYSGDLKTIKAPPSDSARLTAAEPNKNQPRTQAEKTAAAQKELKRLNNEERQAIDNIPIDVTAEERAAKIEQIRNQKFAAGQEALSIIEVSKQLYRLNDLEKQNLIKPRARYAEDLSDSNQTAVSAVVPISIDESDSVSTLTNGQGIEEHFYEGRNFYGSMLNQMYSLGVPEWMNIELEIRGDPHWFGFNQLSKFKSLFKNVTAQGGLTESSGRLTVQEITDTASLVVPIDKLDTELRAHIEGTTRSEPNNSPRFETAQQGFLINFYTPSIFRDPEEHTNKTNDLGYQVHKKSAFVSGVYLVINVQSKFEGGLFTQTIKAMRDPHTANSTLESRAKDIATIAEERKQSSTKNQPITSIKREILPTDMLATSNNSLASKNNNPGNIQYGEKGYFGAIGKRSGFGIYETPTAGAQAMSTQLDRYVTGKTTGTPLETTNDIISTWAPAGHGNNNPVAYANTVAAKVGISPTDNIASRLKTDVNFKARFMSAMTDVEAGNGHGYTPDFMKKAIT